jgi:hypothetical protein
MREGADFIENIDLALDLVDGSVVKREVKPNQPLHLVTSEVEVKNIRLRIVPTVTSYRFALEDITLFVPTLTSPSQTFTTPLPTPYNVLPKIVFQSRHESVLASQPGRIFGSASGLTANEPLHFSTQLDPELDWVHGVRLDYHLPPAYKDAKRCSLTLQFNWMNGKTERQVCFEKSNGNLYIPMASFIVATDKPLNLGALKSIDWVFWSNIDKDKGIKESFDLQFSVEGWAMISAADHLRLLPLFNAGDYPVFADTDAEHNKEIATGRYAQKIWLPLKDKALPHMLAVGGQIGRAEHSLFILEQVAVEFRQPISWDRWRELAETPAPYTPPNWPKWLAWFSVMFLACWATWKKGWWSPGKAWALKVLICILRWVLGVAGRLGWHALPNSYLLIGWLAFTLSLYGGGLLVKVGSEQDYFFIFGSLALTFSLRAWLLVLEQRFRRLFPAAAERVYGGAGSFYFFGALVTLVVAATVLSVKLELIAEQLAIVSYYCLVVGTAQAIWALRKGDKKTVEAPNNE